jgi:hypothetical protein
MLLLLPLLLAGILRLPKSCTSLELFAQEGGLVREGTLPITSSAYLASRLIYPFMIDDEWHFCRTWLRR